MHELRLRDDTDRVIRAAQKSSRPKTAKIVSPLKSPADSPSKSLCGRPGSTSGEQWKLPGPRLPLVEVVDDAALTYFMSCYIQCSPFSAYLPVLYGKSRSRNDGLSSAVFATAHATFAMRTGDRRYLDRGRQNYALALRRTNDSLQDPVAAVLDQTLASILLLGLFETTVFAGRASPEEWTAHMNGALQLLLLRGKQQFDSDVAADLFAHAANNIRASCVQRGVEVPADLQALTLQARPFLQYKNPLNRLSSLVEDLASINSRIDDGRNDQIESIMNECIDVGRRATVLIEDHDVALMPAKRLQEDVPSWTNCDVAIHYPSRRAAKFCNGLFLIRLFLNQLIWAGACRQETELQRRGDALFCAQHTTSYAAIKNGLIQDNANIATQILASVPNFIETSSDGHRFSPEARTLVWPLNLVYTCTADQLPASLRQQARFFLLELSTDLNWMEAANTARVVNEQGIDEDWRVDPMKQETSWTWLTLLHRLHLYHLD